MIDITLRLPHDSIREMIVKDLAVSYRSHESDANRPKAGLTLNKLQDRRDSRKIRKALLKVLAYYTTGDEFEALNLDVNI